MHEFMKKYGVYIVVGAVLIAGIIAFRTFRSSPAGAGVGDESKAFFVDEETGEESVHPATDIPPLQGKGGKNTLARAVYTSFDGGKTKKLGYLYKYTPEAKAALEEAINNKKNLDEVVGSKVVAGGLLYRLPDPKAPWVKAQSKEGSVIDDQAFRSADGKLAIAVNP